MFIEAILLVGSAITTAKYFFSKSPVVSYYAQLSTYFVCLLICSVWGIVATPFMLLAGNRYDIQWLVARSFYELASRWLGITMKVEGWEHLETRPAIYVGNHQSMVDILFLGRIYPKRCTITAKKSLQFSPFLGQWMTMAGAIFIDRGNNKEALRSLQKAGDDLKEKELSIWMFPEGTRTLFQTPNLLPFKKGAFHLAVQSGVPIVPVVCENYWRLYHKGTFGGGELKIKVLPPIPTTGLTTADVTQLSIDTREVMLKALQELSVPVSTPVAEADNAALAKVAEEFKSTSTSLPIPPGGDPTHLSPTGGAPKMSAPESSGQMSPSSSFLSDASAVHVNASAEASGARDRKISVSSAESSDDMVMVDRPNSAA
ncbi:1-acylglycerol-3-phosphate O-acyltransferase [Tulasnella sp. UAMH 9824]|nr:1-acylglycerol-3-phosphate O-acyltransferase [Tulasnella sp. UAMH 9824]